MVTAQNRPQKHKLNVKPLELNVINNDVTNHDNSCNSIECLDKPISRCTVCFKYYCHTHVRRHSHSMDNFEILT
jgi:hypothetical protein